MLVFLKSLFLVLALSVISVVAFAGEKAVEPESIFSYFTIVLSALFAISEALAAIPAVKANSIYQFIHNALKALTKKDETILTE